MAEEKVEGEAKPEAAQAETTTTFTERVELLKASQAGQSTAGDAVVAEEKKEEAAKVEASPVVDDAPDGFTVPKKVKFDGADIDLKDAEEAVALIQKGKLYDKKQHELGQLKRDLEAQAAQKAEVKEEVRAEAKPDALDMRLENARAQITAYLQEDPDDHARQMQAARMWEQEKALHEMGKELQSVKSWKTDMDKRTQEQKMIDSAWGDIKTLMSESGLSQEEAIALWDEGRKAGIANPVAYHRLKNFDSIKAKIEADAVKRGVDEAKKASSASVRSTNRARDEGGQFVNWANMNDEARRLHRINLLRERQIK